MFDSQLLKILENYEQILSIVLPTLRKERRESYSPFLPICRKTGKVLQVPVKVIDKNKGIIAYKGNDNTYIETLVTKGMCKLQWKVDWAIFISYFFMFLPSLTLSFNFPSELRTLRQDSECGLNGYSPVFS